MYVHDILFHRYQVLKQVKTQCHFYYLFPMHLYFKVNRRLEIVNFTMENCRTSLKKFYLETKDTSFSTPTAQNRTYAYRVGHVVVEVRSVGTKDINDLYIY